MVNPVSRSHALLCLVQPSLLFQSMEDKGNSGGLGTRECTYTEVAQKHLSRKGCKAKKAHWFCLFVFLVMMILDLVPIVKILTEEH